VSGEPAPELVGALRDAQRLGFLGPRPVSDVIDHARGFVRALAPFAPIETVLDLGSGGGVPGLIIAHDLPNAQVTLLDRRAKRTDVLERVIRRLGWQDRVAVRCEDVETFAVEEPFGAVVARGFGPPAFTIAQASRFVRDGGPIVISEPPGEDRWDPQFLDDLHLRRIGQPAFDPVTTRAPESHAGGELDGLMVVFVRN
jgi:16S rRNA (guanine527-N7)-methyltransferase